MCARETRVCIYTREKLERWNIRGQAALFLKGQQSSDDRARH
uniref:Uncharacterized protein n=1 Tax=Myoviridae sp. ctRPH1 TaxID=2826650 RepID=A0A8S5MAN8_9CAUD|nr:MAG TPA: hypothetical protein [Myoviridae sp. ctRPH1]